MAKLKLGELLIKSGAINEDQLEKALKFQVLNKCLIGEALIKLGYSNEEIVTITLAKQLGIPYASKENNILTPEKGQNLEKLVPEKFARENFVIPLFIENDSIAVALADPSNMVIVDNLRLMTNLEIQSFIATKTQILHQIDNFYQKGRNLIDQAIDSPASLQDKDPTSIADVDASIMEGKLDLDKVIAGDTKGAQSIRLVNAILKQAITERASDIHLELFDERPSLRFRIDGVLYERTLPPRELVSALISRIKIIARLDISERRLPQDGSYVIRFQNRSIEVRVSTCPTVFGEKLVLRLLDKGSSDVTIDKLGFEPKQMDDFLKAAQHPHGLIFLTGPTGSGKTTTLNAVLTAIRTTEKNFMTLEDPVEYKLEGISQVQVKPQIGLTFASGLRSFLRQDPDVILVGEVRDHETAEACLRAAMTGHIVLSTLHTNDALGAIPRLIDMGIEPYLLAHTLLLVASQRLIRVLCPHCKLPYKPSPALADTAIKESMLSQAPEAHGLTFYREKGCEKCAKTGFLGRKAIYEIFLITEEMRRIIYKTQDQVQLKLAADKTGSISMKASGWRKVILGITTTEEVTALAMD